jgi:uncharacterized membrane protein
MVAEPGRDRARLVLLATPTQRRFLVTVASEHTNTNKWMTMAAGGALALGAALLYREFAGRGDTRQRLSGSRGIHVDEAVTVNKPIAEVYRFWRNFENLPKFMHHLESVAVREAGVTHWVAKGPAGMHVAWDARIINEIDDRVIAWQSLEGSTIATAGSVNFDETAHGTRVRVHFQYSPPAGKLGAAVAYIFGEEPRLQVRDDLRRFKQLIETGEIPTTEGQPSGRVSRLTGGHR